MGKSSTLNAIEPGMQLVTGSVSEKIGRGKHTTRFAHLLPFAGGYLADTPGFGNLNLEELDDKKLAACFREFAGFEDGCKFTPCTHTHEPICGVKDALAAGEIAQSRYESYLTILEEIKIQKGKGRKKMIKVAPSILSADLLIWQTNQKNRNCRSRLGAYRRDGRCLCTEPDLWRAGR